MSGMLIVNNIQRFCLHDGPGIRTTVFLQGCSLHCPWCCNPECIPLEDEYASCFQAPPVRAERMTPDKLFSEIMRDSFFFFQGGGVTFSGGEPLLQAHNLVELLINLKHNNINICLETSLFASKDNLNLLWPYIDIFYIDIKILSEESCANILGGSLDLFRDNLDFLISQDCTIIGRIPVIAGFTDSENNKDAIVDLLKERRGGIRSIELLKGHNLAQAKISPDERAPIFPEATNESLVHFKDRIASLKIPVSILKV